MEKSFRGITKEDFRDAFVYGSEIIVQYVEVYDHDENHSTKFDNDICIEDTPENRQKILEVFGHDLDEGKQAIVSGVRRPEKNVVIQNIDIITTAWYVCPHCGCTTFYEIEGYKKREDMHYIIHTSCCDKRLEIKGKEDM
jgi:hypothetical protein